MAIIIRLRSALGGRSAQTAVIRGPRGERVKSPFVVALDTEGAKEEPFPSDPPSACAAEDGNEMEVLGDQIQGQKTS